MNDYLNSVLSQANDLRSALAKFDPALLVGAAKRIQSFDRIVLTGMGASLYAGYPAFLTLAQRGLPAWHVEAAELLHHAAALITPRTLLCVISQSGRSAEIVNLLSEAKERAPGLIVAITNDPGSPVAQAAEVVLPICAGAERSVSTRTYVNTLAVLQLTAAVLAGDGCAAIREDLGRTIEAVDSYLSSWNSAVDELTRLIQTPSRLFVLARGRSLATAWTAGLILKEGSRALVEGMSSAQFRHGPLELADSGLTAIVIAGSAESADLNRRLAADLARYGARTLWLGSAPSSRLPTIRIPEVPDGGLPIAEIIPLQLLNLPLARLAGIEPGAFRNLGKVVTSE
jgi:glutamine---fructose-6-phosphate transaminase (isomerizing)